MPGEVTFPELLETQRLLLRRYRIADAPGILELVCQSRDRLIRNFSSMAKGLSQEDEARAFTEEKNAQWNGRKAFCYGIWRKGSEDQIGQLQVKNIVWDVPSAELSYFIGPSWQRQGFASEAISAVVQVGFEQFDFKRMFVRVIPSNQESLLLANRLGFRHEGLHRREFRCGLGELHDVHYFSLTDDDFRAGITNT